MSDEQAAGPVNDSVPVDSEPESVLAYTEKELQTARYQAWDEGYVQSLRDNGHRANDAYAARVNPYS